MDEKTVGIIVMGSIVIAMGLFGTYMEGRQQAQVEARKRTHARRLRLSQTKHLRRR